MPLSGSLNLGSGGPPRAGQVDQERHALKLVFQPRRRVGRRSARPWPSHRPSPSDLHRQGSDLRGRVLAQVLAEVRQREVDVAAASGVDQFGRDEAQPVLAGVVDVYAEASLDVCHL